MRLVTPNSPGVGRNLQAAASVSCPSTLNHNVKHVQQALHVDKPAALHRLKLLVSLEAKQRLSARSKAGRCDVWSGKLPPWHSTTAFLPINNNSQNSFFSLILRSLEPFVAAVGKQPPPVLGCCRHHTVNASVIQTSPPSPTTYHLSPLRSPSHPQLEPYSLLRRQQYSFERSGQKEHIGTWLPCQSHLHNFGWAMLGFQILRVRHQAASALYDLLCSWCARGRSIKITGETVSCFLSCLAVLAHGCMVGLTSHT